MFGNTASGTFITNESDGVFGVSTNEQDALRAGTTGGPAHAGWVLRKEGTGGRAGRVTYEVLVAMKSITGDASDDTVIPDYTLAITTEPADSNEATGNAVTFSVAASSTPSGATLTYQWQVDGGVGVWAVISDAGVYSNSATDTLEISDNTGLDGNVYRVIVGTTGAANVVSANAALSEY